MSAGLTPYICHLVIGREQTLSKSLLIKETMNVCCHCFRMYEILPHKTVSRVRGSAAFTAETPLAGTDAVAKSKLSEPLLSKQCLSCCGLFISFFFFF